MGNGDSDLELFAIDRLTSKNYWEWSIRMMALLANNDCEDCIYRQDLPPEDRRRDGKARFLILTHISSSLFHIAAPGRTAKEMWDALALVLKATITDTAPPATLTPAPAHQLPSKSNSKSKHRVRHDSRAHHTSPQQKPSRPTGMLWVFATSATRHILADAKMATGIHSCNTRVRLADGRSIKASGKCTVHMTTRVGRRDVSWTLSNVLLVPAAPQNILSGPALMAHGISFEGRASSGVLFLRKHGRAVGVAAPHDGLNVLTARGTPAKGRGAAAAAPAAGRSKEHARTSPARPRNVESAMTGLAGAIPAGGGRPEVRPQGLQGLGPRCASRSNARDMSSTAASTAQDGVAVEV